MKKSIIFLILTLSILNLSACGESEQLKENPTEEQTLEEQTEVLQFVRYMDAGQNLAEYRDDETGVHYILYVVKDVNEQDHGSNGIGVGVGVGASITERLDSDGQPYVEETYKPENQTSHLDSEELTESYLK